MGSNCTLVELKYNIELDDDMKQLSSNCTLVELKSGNNILNRNKLTVLIVP